MANILRLAKNMNTATKTIAISLVFLMLISQIQTTEKYVSLSNRIYVYAINDDPSADYFEGYNLFILERENTTSHSIIDRKILITDMNNNIILEKEALSTSVLADIEFYNSSTILYGDIYSTKLWNFETDTVVDLGFGGHHDIEINYLNSTFFTLDIHDVDIDVDTYIYDLINEYNSTGSLLRSIDTSDFVEPWQICPFANTENVTIDITHANSLSFEEDEQAIYLNCRNTNTFYKIDYESGEKIWGLGEYGNFTMYDIYGNERDNLFFHSHSLEKISDNRFLLFDNDNHNQTNAVNKQSRYVEITIDEDKMFANVSWEWNSPTEYWSPIWGDCNILPNNNRVGVFGYTTFLGQKTGSKIIEVNNEGDIVWKLESPIEEEILYTVNRMERFRFSPIVSTPVFVNTENENYFEWNGWYNFRSKTRFTGRYYILLDNQLMLSDNISFPKYWQPVQINYTLGEIKPGNHEIALIFEDDSGHRSNESTFYTGDYEFKINFDKGIVLGISLGISIPAALTISTVVGKKYFRKRRKN
ncbi:MAG: aryl-sulfate sulfotransferase [Candidatus Heimdallarchaeaceae archaeon]